MQQQARLVRLLPVMSTVLIVRQQPRPWLLLPLLPWGWLMHTTTKDTAGAICLLQAASAQLLRQLTLSASNYCRQRHGSRLITSDALATKQLLSAMASLKTGIVVKKSVTAGGMVQCQLWNCFCACCASCCLNWHISGCLHLDVACSSPTNWHRTAC